MEQVGSSQIGCLFFVGFTALFRFLCGEAFLVVFCALRRPLRGNWRH